MTNEQKANELGFKFFPDEENIWARNNVEATKCALACLWMAQWKEEQIKQLIHYADKMYECAFNLGPVGQGETLRNAMEEYKNFKFKEIYK